MSNKSLWPVLVGIRFNANVFGIPPDGSIYKIQQDSGWGAAAHFDYLVYNIGKTEVVAEARYGSKVMWHGIVTTATVKPGEKKTIPLKSSELYWVTGLFIYNTADRRGVVHCSVVELETKDKLKPIYPTYLAQDINTFDNFKKELIRRVFDLGVKYVPYVGKGLSTVTSLFWPEGAPNVWQDIHNTLRKLVKSEVLDMVNGIITGDLNQYKERIETLAREVRDGGSKEDHRFHYMDIAKDFIGFEKKLILDKKIADYKNVNQFILPMYSAVVLMKITFYTIGIRTHAEIGLTKEDVRKITYYANRTINSENGANAYITNMYKERVENAYSTGYTEEFYDILMSVRTFIATQGLEYIQLWNHMIYNPEYTSQPYIDVISYSALYGRQTTDAIKEALADEMCEPLTPKLIDGKRKRLKSVVVYMWRLDVPGEDKESRIGGMRLRFGHETRNGICNDISYSDDDDDDEEDASDSVYLMGTESDEFKKIKFKAALLMKLVVFGEGAIDCLVFHFSDGRIIECGTKISWIKFYAVYEMKDHHIVSFHLAGDNPPLQGQAGNISVAYQLIPKS